MSKSKGNLRIAQRILTEPFSPTQTKTTYPSFEDPLNHQESEAATKLFELQLKRFRECESVEEAQKLAENTKSISIFFAPHIAEILHILIDTWETTPTHREALLAVQPFLEAMAEQHLPLQKLTYATKTETGYCQIRTQIEYVPDAAHPFGYVAFVKEISSLEPYQYEKVPVMPSVQWLQEHFPELQPTPPTRTNQRKTGKKDRKTDPSHKNERMLTEVESPLDGALVAQLSDEQSIDSFGQFARVLPVSQLENPSLSKPDENEQTLQGNSDLLTFLEQGIETVGDLNTIHTLEKIIRKKKVKLKKEASSVPDDQGPLKHTDEQVIDARRQEALRKLILEHAWGFLSDADEQPLGYVKKQTAEILKNPRNSQEILGTLARFCKSKAIIDDLTDHWQENIWEFLNIWRKSKGKTEIPKGTPISFKITFSKDISPTLEFCWRESGVSCYEVFGMKRPKILAINET